MTVRAYADRHGWQLHQVDVDLQFDPRGQIVKNIRIVGDLEPAEAAGGGRPLSGASPHHGRRCGGHRAHDCGTVPPASGPHAAELTSHRRPVALRTAEVDEGGRPPGRDGNDVGSRFLTVGEHADVDAP
ncbi:hypothetical protein [Streptomyces sp. NBC_00316]|uniref:hypothetical protein n=1 Tax=Streptomyces sp. NBC_00316 TaxID=2975710 RepID=UPI002E2C5D07|nr:hypothetical protein [Streptomyces sp. NBC_00316]